MLLLRLQHLHLPLPWMRGRSLIWRWHRLALLQRLPPQPPAQLPTAPLLLGEGKRRARQGRAAASPPSRRLAPWPACTLTRRRQPQRTWVQTTDPGLRRGAWTGLQPSPACFALPRSMGRRLPQRWLCPTQHPSPPRQRPLQRLPPHGLPPPLLRVPGQGHLVIYLGSGVPAAVVASVSRQRCLEPPALLPSGHPSAPQAAPVAPARRAVQRGGSGCHRQSVAVRRRRQRWGLRERQVRPAGLAPLRLRLRRPLPPPPLPLRTMTPSHEASCRDPFEWSCCHPAGFASECTWRGDSGAEVTTIAKST